MCAARRIGLAGMASAFIALLAAPAHAANVDVSFAAFAYNPALVRVAPGDTVTWTGAPPNTFDGSPPAGPTKHPLAWVNAAFPERVDAASTHSQAFPAAGRFAYFCRSHGVFGMTGAVTVTMNRLPIASFTAGSAVAGQPVTFTSTSSDPDPGQTLTYEWDLDGDGAYDPGVGGPQVARTYSAPGAITVRHRVTDSNAEAAVGPESAEATVAITVEPATPAAEPAPVAPGAAPPGALPDRVRPVVRLVATTLRRLGATVSARVGSSEAGGATLRLLRDGTTLATGTARFPAGGRRSVRMRLTARGRALLRPGRLVRATLAISVRDAAGNTTLLRGRVTVRG